MELNDRIIYENLESKGSEEFVKEIQSILQTDKNFIFRYLNQVSSILNYLESQRDNPDSKALMAELRRLHILTVMKTGYTILHQLRQQIFQTPITYNIGLSYYGSLYSRSDLSLEDVLSVMTLGRQSRNKTGGILSPAIRFAASKGQMKESLDLKLADATTLNLFNRIKYYQQRYFKKGNLGNLYEVTILALSKGFTHEISSAQLRSLFKEVLANSLPFYKGGDVGNLQVKAFLKSAPSVGTLQTIYSALSDYQTIMTQASQSDIRNAGLQLLFSEQKLSEVVKTIHSTAEDQALQELKKLLKETGLEYNI